MHILAISGSLRQASLNTTLLRAVALLVPDGVTLALYNDIGVLPHFNPDLDRDPAPSAVADFRARLQAADGVVICSPEYAHGVPGAFKNALDWVVGSGEFVGKPVAVINASPIAVHAQASLIEILTVMDAKIITAASVTVPLYNKRLDAAGMVADPDIANTLRRALIDFSR